MRIDDPQFINPALDQQVRILPDLPYPPVKGIETILQELARTYFDNKKHHQPHVHVESSDDEAVISIPDGAVLEGTLRTAKLKLVQAWIEIHKEELMADWNRAVSGQPVFKIDPLR